MAKSNKPYNDNKTKKSKKELEYTTRIRIDKDRLNDYDSLDTSFLEGRLDKKIKNSRVSREKFYKEKKPSKINWELVRSFFYLIGTLFVIVTIIVFLVRHDFFKGSTVNNEEVKVVNEEKTKKEETKQIDDNYLFVGDFYTDKFNFDNLDYKYVKECGEDYTTDDILNDMKNKIYLYNPSIVFIQLGINDLDSGKSEDDIVDNISKIIDGIKENRPYAKIYIESLYPINKDVDDFDDDILDDEIDNELISSLNSKIKKITEEKKVNYLDIYSFISEDNKLSDKYSDNGIYLNEDGYMKILKEIKRVVE